MIKCVRCKGTGVVTWVENGRKTELGCEDCNGTGKIHNSPWTHFSTNPEKKDMYFALDKDNFPFLDEWNGEYWEGLFHKEKVIHWMAVPEPPKDLSWKHGSTLPEVDGEYLTISKDEREVKIKEFSSRIGWHSYGTITFWSEIPE